MPSTKHNRSRTEIVTEVMRNVSSGVEAPTLLYHRTYIPWKLLRKILDRLVLAKFVTIERRGTRRRYKLTQKGDLILRQLEEVFATLSPVTDSWEWQETLRLPTGRSRKTTKKRATPAS